MDTQAVKAVLRAAHLIHEEISKEVGPPAEISAAIEEPILPHALFRGTRGYIEKIVYQINSCYLSAAYDGCAVMVRRLVEVLIIEAFEAKGIGAKVKDGDGNYLLLGDLVAAALNENTWSLSRTAKRGLGQLKEIGDLSAHSRMYNAKRQYVDDIKTPLRVVAEEFLYHSGLRK